MTDKQTTDEIKVALHTIEDAIHAMMKALMAKGTSNADITAALLTVAQNSAAAALARLITAGGAELVTDSAAQLFKRTLESSFRMAGYVVAERDMDGGEARRMQ